MDNNEAFEKWWKNSVYTSPTFMGILDKTSAYGIWQAAQQQSAGEIKRLSLLSVKTLDELNQELCNENDALKADNERLRKLCEKILADLETQNVSRDTMQLLREAISATTSSLVEHDNEVKG